MGWFSTWWNKPAEWYQFWQPQSGWKGGVILGVIVGLLISWLVI